MAGGGRPSILDVLRAWDGAGHPPELPDETPPDLTEIRWAPGARDGLTTHHVGPPEGGRLRGLVARIGRRDPAGDILKALRGLARHPGEAERRKLGALLLADDALATVDTVLERVAADPDLGDRLAPHARRLAETTSDREPLKFAIALLGVCGSRDDVPLLHTLGRHDEFALYSVVALGNLLGDATGEIWEVARTARGWGKIQAVERLASAAPERADVRRWLLTDGCANEIMDEYLAYECATAGGLAAALAGDVDDALLDGACTIVSALCTEDSPAATLAFYEDGPRAVDLLLGELETRCTTLARLATVRDIRRWLEEEEEEASGWPDDLRRRVADRCAAILARDHWRHTVEEAFLHGPQEEQWRARALAADVGADLWEHGFARLTEGGPDPTLVFDLLADPDGARRERVVRWLEEALPLERLGSGPDQLLFPPPEAREENDSLNFAVHAMSDGRLYSEALVAAALLSPVINSRNAALNALEVHPRPRWGAAAERALERLAREEPTGDVAARVRALA